MTLICRVWRDSAYLTYDYLPHDLVVAEYLAKGEQAMLALAAAMPWEVPHDLATAGIHGEPNTFSDNLVDGIPVEILEALGERFD
jgi:hypothetical protein